MRESIVSSVLLNTVAHYWRVMEKAGMTPAHVQRVIERPQLRKAIIDLIEADMKKLWQPDENPPKIPTNLDRMLDPFERPSLIVDSDGSSVSSKLRSVFEALSTTAARGELAFKLYDRLRDPLPLLYSFGLIGNREISIEELASGFDVTSRTIDKRIRNARSRLASRARYLLMHEYSAVSLLKVGLVTSEWAVASDDVRILQLSPNAFQFLDLAIPQHLRHISQITALTEAQLTEMVERVGWGDKLSAINEIKAELAKYGLSLAESEPAA